MDRQSALASLQLDDDASDALIWQVIKDQRAVIEEQLSATTGVARRVQWQKELSNLDDIEDALLGRSSTGEHRTEIVDRRGRALEDDEGRGDGEMVSGRRPPPIPLSETGFDPEAATQILSPSDSRSVTQDGWRTATGVKVTRKPNLPPPLATDDDKTKLIGDAKAPNSSRSLWLIMAIFMLLLLMAAAGGYAAWVGLYLPSQLAKHRATGVQSLVALISDVTGMPEDGERSHAKVRSLCWLATALASTGHRSEATPLITAANELIAKWEGEQTHREDLCRLFAAHAAWGDPQAAVKELGTLQAEREQAARSVKGASNAPPPRIPLHEDNARRAIAIALARQSKGSEAVSIVGAISSLHDDCAAEALCEVARQFKAAGNVSGATDVFRQIEQRAGKVSDPLTRAALVVSVAPQVQALLGDAKAMSLV